MREYNVILKRDVDNDWSNNRSLKGGSPKYLFSKPPTPAYSLSGQIKKFSAKISYKTE